MVNIQILIKLNTFIPQIDQFSLVATYSNIYSAT